MTVSDVIALVFQTGVYLRPHQRKHEWTLVFAFARLSRDTNITVGRPELDSLKRVLDEVFSDLPLVSDDKGLGRAFGLSVEEPSFAWERALLAASFHPRIWQWDKLPEFLAGAYPVYPRPFMFSPRVAYKLALKKFVLAYPEMAPRLNITVRFSRPHPAPRRSWNLARKVVISAMRLILVDPSLTNQLAPLIAILSRGRLFMEKASMLALTSATRKKKHIPIELWTEIWNKYVF